ncbi:MAG: hypothetical protein EBT07_10290 [Actinobacteria bacterium]|nr:hypothetical protein [Actinomycetota bacterium]
MLLIFTNSLDGTVDLLLRETDRPIFRFNIDLWRDYSLALGTSGFDLADPHGRRIDERSMSSCYWRKVNFNSIEVVPVGGSVDHWLEAQWRYVFREMWNIGRELGKARLTEAGGERRFGKLMQLRRAKKYFNVADWLFTKQDSPPLFEGSWITKGFAAEFVGNHKVFYTREVKSGQLDPAYPWFLQSKIEASHDLTVVYVAGRCFAFTLDRRLFQGVDWRVDINRVEHPWTDHELTPDLRQRICDFMDEADLSFGRLDFLLKDGVEWFLEVNPNGQFAWLDQSGRQGMLKAILEELTTTRPTKPIRPLLR